MNAVLHKGSTKSCRVRRICKTCGKEFLVIPARIKYTGAIYCSLECANVGGSGENSPHWKGGISFEPYCEKFSRKLKREIRTDYNKKCFVCGISQQDNGKCLSIHHVDYNKMQGCGGRRWNLLPLCRRCHTATNHRRWYWFLLLYNHWAIDAELFMWNGVAMYNFHPAW
jgi:hypothetical protein